MKRFRALLAGATLVVLGGGLGTTLGASATATTLGTATLVGEAGNYVVGAQTLAFTSVPAPALRGPSIVTFILDSPGHGFQLWFAPAAGDTWHLGAYENAERADYRSAGHPGIDLFGDGRGCNTVTGRFVVDQLKLDSTGLPVVFSAQFEFHCEGWAPAVTGSISYSSPLHSYSVSTEAIDFGTTRPNKAVDRVVTITNDGTEALSLTASPMTGANASQFSVTANTCAGHVLAPNATCSLTVRFRPVGRPGFRNATFSVKDETGIMHSIALSGLTLP
jgi:hypothetical protein